MAVKKRPIQIPVSDEVRWKLTEEAARRKMTLAEFIRYGLQAFIDSEKVEIDLSEGLATYGGWRGGPKDKRDTSDE